MATLVPHVYPDLPPGLPAVLDRRAAAAHRRRRARCGGGPTGWWRSGSSRGASEYNDCARRGSGCGPLPYVHTGLSRSLTMVGDAAAARVPAGVAVVVRVVGPLLWEPGGPLVEPPPGDGPVVLVAPSTSQDPSDSLLRACLEGLADEPVRVIAIAATGRSRRRRTRCSCPGCPTRGRCRAATSWSRHGGHGTLARALASGCPVVVCPAGGRHGRERRAGRLGGRRRAARAALLHAVGRAAGGPAGAVGSRELRARAAALAAWAFANPGPATAAAQLERWAATPGVATAPAE